jgi:ABC-2 type transport system permease protein
MREIFLIARRDYFAYVAAWGFWVSLITAPVLVAAIALAPLLLSRAEPARLIAIVADRPEDAQAAVSAIEDAERSETRLAVEAFVRAAAPRAATAALAAFDAEAERAAALAAARAVVAREAPAAVRAFPQPTPRYRVVEAPARTPQGLAPYLTGARLTVVDGAPRALFGALIVERADGSAQIEYWSANLADERAANRVYRAIAENLRLEALAARGLTPEDARAIEDLAPTYGQFDPREGASAGAVTTEDRAPLLVAIILSFVLWTAVFGVANMLLTSVLEEKSNKILDSLLTSVTPLQILIGKLAGVAAVSATFFAVWGGVGAGVSALLNRVSPANGLAEWAALALTPELAVMFVVCFVAGYLMYGAIFLALGSLCESNQEAQTLMGPVFLVLTAPILLLAPAFLNPSSPLVAGAAWVPLFTPFLMIMRAPAGLAWYELAGPLALMTLTVMVVLWGAARVFQAGAAGQADASSLRRLVNPFRSRKEPDA